MEDRSQAQAVLTGDASGGPNTSHTNQVEALARLLEVVPADGGADEYKAAAIDQNALGKETRASRRRSFRYLRELYLFRSDAPLFDALRRLSAEEPEALPLLATLSAMARDPVFRASAQVIVSTAPGEEVSTTQLGSAVNAEFPGNYKASSLAKIGRNVSSSWEQAGHLQSLRPSMKVRRKVNPAPTALAYALFIGHLRGRHGGALLEEPWPAILDLSATELLDLATVAAGRGLIEFRHAGGVVEFGFRELSRGLDRAGM